MATKVTIYHNPKCSKSRQALAYLQENGIEPQVINYLDTPLKHAQLKGVLKKLKISARELLRTGEKDYKELGLKNQQLDEDKLLQLMIEYPKLMQRPIVEAGNKAVMARPAELIDSII